MIQIGQGVLGRIPFKDGEIPRYDRTYLVVGIDSTNIELLNVSSVIGKEHKLLFPHNKLIVNFNPPFVKSSFVKLDSLTDVPLSMSSSLRILHNGDCLDSTELQSIIDNIVRVS